jgi:asparagine synthase (glutamine-hydrolysing)
MLRAVFDPADFGRLFAPEFSERVGTEAPAQWFASLYEDAELPDEVAYAQRHDMLTYLPDDLLVKTDIASMAASLELRPPLLDRDLACVGLSLPTGLKLDRRRGKLALREAFADDLPTSVWRRPKRGFGVPLGAWLRTALSAQMRDVLLDRSFLDRGIFQPVAIHGLINDHLGGADDHSHRLWALMVLARWLAGR